MKNIRKAICFIGFIAFLIFFIGYNYQFLVGGENPSKSENEWNELKSAAYTSIAPFILDDSGGGDYTWGEAFNISLCTGSGIWNDPYIIENVAINGLEASTCLTITHSNAYFIIKNSFFNNSGIYQAGIRLNRVINGRLVNNTCSQNYFGIFLDNACSNITISENIVNRNLRDGIGLFNSTDNFILKNSVKYNEFNGICLNISFGDIVSRNAITNNKENGVRVSLSTSVNISLNTINLNTLGISLADCTTSIIASNTLIHNRDCIIEENCSGNTIMNNECVNLYFGFISLYTLIGGIGAVAITLGGLSINNAISRPKRETNKEISKISSLKTEIVSDEQPPSIDLKDLSLTLVKKVSVVAIKKLIKDSVIFDLYLILAKEFLAGCSLCREGKYGVGLKKLEDVNTICSQLVKPSIFVELRNVSEDFFKTYSNQQQKIENDENEKDPE